MNVKYLFYVALLLIFSIATNVSAQTPPSLPPTIIAFESNLSSLSLRDIEAGRAQITFQWYTVGLNENYRLLLDKYIANTWYAYDGDLAAPLPPTGSLTIKVDSTLTFGPPMYRLGIYDLNGERITERILILPYNEESYAAAPQIAHFSTPATELNIGKLAAGTALIEVEWLVMERHPRSNLSFEQMLEDGTAVSVELPRSNLWISSAGRGTLQPVLPQVPDNPVRLRLQVVDVLTNIVYAEAEIGVPLAGDAITATPKVNVSNLTPAAPHDAEEIVAFTVSPTEVNRGDRVTISWDVRGVEKVFIHIAHDLQRFPSGDTVNQQAGGFTTSGTTTYTIPDLPIQAIIFSPIWPATAENGVLVTVRCPFTWFAPAQTNACPNAQPATLPAAYQVFEQGFMIWHSGFIWIFDNTSSQGMRFSDTWQAGEPITYEQQAPRGRMLAEHGFGKIWVENTSVRDTLGWATAPEQGYNTLYQDTQDFYDGFDYYFTLPDDRVLYLDSRMNSYNWRYLG